MADEIIGQKLRYMSQDKFETITEKDDEFYAVSGSGIGFLSNISDELTLGASGTQYTAPGNGWFYFRRALQANKNITIFNVTKGNIFVRAMASFGVSGTCLMPACKGDIVSVGYDSTAGTGDEFKFIYAEGD